MGNFNTELEILQDENFAIKAPKGFKGSDWRSKNGRTGRVLFSKYSPDYISSDCYITVSTVAKDPITSEIRKRVEAYIGADGFDFEFTKFGDRNAVFYCHEEEVDYKTYHAFILMNDKKAIMVDVIFNTAFDNSRDIAHSIISSIKTNFSAEVTEEELAADAARLAAEDQAEAAKRAHMEAEKQHRSQAVEEVLQPDADVEEAEVELVEEELYEATVKLAEEKTFDNPIPESATNEEPEEAQEEAAVLEESAETEEAAEPEFEDTDDGRKMRVIYESMKQHSKMTLSELQTVPELVEVGRMGITQLMNQMIRREILIRFEDVNNIYFALPGYQEREAADENTVMDDMSAMDRYKLEMEQYKAALAEWKKSKDFFGRTDMPKPVEPVKPKKQK